MSPLLQEFYKEIHRHIHDRNYQPRWFLHSAGLCMNLIHFLDSKNITVEEKIDIRFELRKSFSDKGLSEHCPFNETANEFQLEQFKYENKNRVEWVNDHV